VLTVLATFIVIFVVLFALIGYTMLRRESGEIDHVTLMSARSFALALDETDDDAVAATAVSLLRRVTLDAALSADTGPPLDLAAARLDGRFAQPGILAPGLDLPQLRDGVNDDVAPGLRAYVASSRHWKVALIDRPDERGRWTLAALFADLALYLAIALPLVLLPVWWAVRSGLAPLRQLSRTVAQRDPLDTRPLPPGRIYRELQPLHTALERLFERVAQGLAREKVFVHDAAHEMRTPLAVVSAQAQVLVQSEGPERAAAHERLQAAVTRASHLTHQLLDLAQADARAVEPGITMDLTNEAGDAMALLADRADAQGTELELIGPDRAPLAANPRIVRSIIDNLLDNALRHGGAGGLVRLQIALDGEAWHIRVSDRGPGIAETDRERVFERFWRGSTKPGSGLGLAIVRQAARAMGGDAWVEARGEKGTTVSVRLPVKGSWPPPRERG
jgi:signal transduction histidine kinase